MTKRSIEYENTQNKRVELASKDDEILSAVILQTNGDMQEKKLSLNEVSKYIGGSWNYLGGWDENSTMMIIREDQDEDLPQNTHKLQPPYHKATIKGDIVIIKNDDNNNRVDFSLQEYEEFLKLDIEPWELEDGNDVENDEADEQQLYENILSSVLTELEEIFQREVSESEQTLIKGVIETVSEELRSLDEQEDVDEPDLNKISEDIKQKVLTWFEDTHKRRPNETETTIIDTSVTRIIVSAAVDDDSAVQRASLQQNIVDQLVDDFKRANDRDPDDDEMVDLQNQAEELMNSVANEEVDDDGDEGGEEDDDEDEGDEEEED